MRQRINPDRIMRVYGYWINIQKEFSAGRLKGKISELMVVKLKEEGMCRATFFAGKKKLGLQ